MGGWEIYIVGRGVLISYFMKTPSPILSTPPPSFSNIVKPPSILPCHLQLPPPLFFLFFCFFGRMADSTTFDVLFNLIYTGLYLGFECNFCFFANVLFWESGDNLGLKRSANSCKWFVFAAGVQEKSKHCRAFKVAHVVNLKLDFLDYFLYNLVMLIKLCKIQYLN